MNKMKNLRRPGAWGKANMLACHYTRVEIREQDRRELHMRLLPHQRETLAKMFAAVTGVMTMPRRIGVKSLADMVHDLTVQAAREPLIIDPLILTGRLSQSEPASGLDQLRDLQSRSRLLRGGARREVKVVPFTTRPSQHKTSMFEEMWGEAHKDEPKFVPIEMDFDKVEQRILASYLNDVPTPIDREAVSGHPIWPEGTKLVSGRHQLAGEKGKLCYRTACQRPMAFWFNRSTRKYYCADCARDLNTVNRDMKYDDGRPLCVEEGPNAIKEDAHTAKYLGMSGEGPGRL